jgi:DNA-binding response OmpR family regulator
MTSARILVIDDEPHIRRLMRLALTAQSFEVVDARGRLAWTNPLWLD